MYIKCKIKIEYLNHFMSEWVIILVELYPRNRTKTNWSNYIRTIITM